jgi:hypothetical protein
MTMQQIQQAQLNANNGLSNAELEAEVVSELPVREEMSGFHRWFRCYDYYPCYEFHPCYDYCYDYPCYEF